MIIFCNSDLTVNKGLETTTSEADINPRVIYPHPVPFLKPAPKMHTATQ